MTKKRISHSIELIRRSPTSQLPAGFCTPCFRAVDKYMMHTYQASVGANVNGQSQVIKTEIRAMNAQDVRWLLWAQDGFHSIQAGPAPIAPKKGTKQVRLAITGLDHKITFTQ